jgi:hypothetical protein
MYKNQFNKADIQYFQIVSVYIMISQCSHHKAKFNLDQSVFFSMTIPHFLEISGEPGGPPLDHSQTAAMFHQLHTSVMLSISRV